MADFVKRERGMVGSSCYLHLIQVAPSGQNWNSWAITIHLSQRKNAPISTIGNLRERRGMLIPNRPGAGCKSARGHRPRSHDAVCLRAMSFTGARIVM